MRVMTTSPGTREASCAVLGLLLVLSSGPALAADAPSREEAARALRRAVRYFREKVATRGGYLWEYSSDLKERRGEGKATASQIWVQPPGTPSVGLAYLRAYERTGEAFHLDAARETAHALAWGQLGSGGWTYSIDFDPAGSKHRFHRRDVEAGQRDPGDRFNVSTFDDDTSQSALRLIMSYDRVTGFKDEVAHRAALYALRHFLKAQYPSGGWPQRYVGPRDPRDWPTKPAHYPESWSRVHPKSDYKFFYTLNDHTIPDLITTMLVAYDVYGERVYLESALKGGDFLLLAQMPEPQPAWAQQYDADMAPAWARRFEPPSIVSVESIGAIRALMRLYVETGAEKYRSSIPRALDWLERSRLSDGRHARFYELRTNRPLYFTRKYELVYTDDDLPTHYCFQTTLDVTTLRRQYDRLGWERQQQVKQAGDRIEELRGAGADERLTVRSHGRPASPSAVRKVIDSLDREGRWIEDGRMKCSQFIRNVDTLSSYLAREP